MEASEGTFGLFELSSDGTVLYSRAGQDGALMIGRDFFREVAAFENKEDLRHHFRRFLGSSRPVDSFGFDCEYGERSVHTKITMTRGQERAEEYTANIVIMDIKQLSI